MADNQGFEPEFEEIFEAFSQGTAQVRSVNYLKLMTQEGLFWLHGTVNAVDTDREFFHLSCSMCARRVWREEDGLMPCVHCGYVNHYDNYRYNLEVEFVDESGRFQGAAVTRLPDWIVEDLEGREAVFEVVKTHEEDVHVFDCIRLSIDELILEACEDNYYPHGVQEEDWDNQSVVTERGESDQEVIWRDLPVYVGEPSGVNDPDATQASKRRRTE
ncbi:hypothetical protein CASFOL_001429 [Castilleja foliolosa]|uniref:Replication factor A C-terminal domain-containing protein n=1 Tax=Castilleja foliolosa TaxID=1961234 RepID=A0ABD3ENN2_9LAMI